MISIIAAIGKNRQLGKENKLLWHIPEDMKRFKRLTQGHAVIMGRKTYESLGKALPERINIVITRDENFSAPNCLIYHSFEKVIEDINSQKIGGGEVFVIGGGEVYRQALPYTDKLYLTLVDDDPSADTLFPDYSIFKKNIYEQKGQCNNLKYTFVELVK